ncbi:protein QNR-71-like isoform X2 [Artemia franciscana]|uniref:protein QNR-71-like isoform X2 n=1 Tax=Artemia franciscana TaxID=6661 RepID=UPI0032DB2317
MQVKSSSIVIAGFFLGVVASLQVSLTSNGPVVLDANITFTASITTSSGEKPQGTFCFEFNDRYEGGHRYTSEKSEDTEVQWTISYPSSKYSADIYTMEVTVSRYYSYFPIPIPEGSASTRYSVTNFLNGQLIYLQNGTENAAKCFVKTGIPITFEVQFHDPENYLSKANLTYLWSLSQKDDFIQTDTASLATNFSTPQKYEVQVQVLADFTPPPPPTTPTPITTTSTTTATTSSIPTTSTAKNVTVVTATASADPVSNISIAGKNWLKHGEVYHIDVTCNGSSMFLYCWEIYAGSYNITGNESCSDPNTSKICRISIFHYFRTPGTYTIPLIITNSVSKEIVDIKVNIYEATKKTNLSMFLVPVICTALAVVAMGVGFAFVTKANSGLAVETADFDFGQEEEVAEFMTFIDRLRSELSRYISEMRQQSFLRSFSTVRTNKSSYGSTEQLTQSEVRNDLDLTD